ncbi:MAG: NADH-quinone oxidoreductase subunit C [Candidatus Magnetoovum sp. WYHC-5]|nr:NADH-quinone oxidoreductase subunit C [Candidatus Magnetoovum sp. WYHC-5]
MEPHSVAERIREYFPEEVLSIEDFRDETTVTVKKESIYNICKFLKESSFLSMDFLRDVTALDWLGRKSLRYEVIYHIYSIKNECMIRLKVPVSDDDLYVDSVSTIWKGANWHERECYDMFGIVFSSHPDLRRILMPEDWEGYPLRKDYPAEGPQEEWRGFKEVLKKAEEYAKYEWNR